VSGEDPQHGHLTVTYRESGVTVTWDLPVVRDVTVEARDEHEPDVPFFQTVYAEPSPPKVLTWSAVPLRGGDPDGRLYTITVSPPPESRTP